MTDNPDSGLGVELKQLAHTYSHLFLRAADAFLIWDAKGNIHNANAAACLLTGYGRDEILGLDHRKLFPDEMRDMLEGILEKSREEEDGGILHEAECELRQKDSELIPATLRLIAVRGPDDANVLGIIHDIRDLKDLEARLALSQARYRGIVENINEVILLLDNTGKILFINAAGERAFGRNREVLIDSDIRELVVPEELPTLEEVLSGSARKNESETRQPSLRMTAPNAEQQEFELLINSIPDERNQPGGTLVIMHNITGRREMEEKLRYAERMRNVEMIMSKITHEVKNPLAAINASAEFLRRHWDVPEEEKREVVDLIADETERINRIITEYLRIRRIPAPTMLNYDILDVVEMVEKSLEKLLSERPNVKLETDVSSAEFAFDADMMKQVLWNLVNNAIDAVGESGKITILGKNEGPDDIFELRVIDDGCGMSDEVLARAFDPFFTSKDHGTGIGLAIVKQMLEIHEGTIDIETSPGSGTTFIVRLPMSGEEMR